MRGIVLSITVNEAAIDREAMCLAAVCHDFNTSP